MADHTKSDTPAEPIRYGPADEPPPETAAQRTARRRERRRFGKDRARGFVREQRA